MERRADRARATHTLCGRDGGRDEEIEKVKQRPRGIYCPPCTDIHTHTDGGEADTWGIRDTYTSLWLHTHRRTCSVGKGQRM